MSENAQKIPCRVVLQPSEEKYINEKIRNFQGCPTIAVTGKGRIFVGWYAGGIQEPHMDNFNLMVYSDDMGESWSKPIVVIPSSKENFVHALDIQLWTAPDGALHIYWVQNNTESAVGSDGKIRHGNYGPTVDGYIFDDIIHAEWRMICRNPDDEELLFSEPECLDKGFLRCKPTMLESGRQLNFNYDQTSDRYGYSVSDDCGKTFRHLYGGKKINVWFDETMAYQLHDGSIRMLARTSVGALAESYSYDNAETWTDGTETKIPNPDTRFFVSRMPSGKILLLNNDHKAERCNLAVYISEDDGKTWAYKKIIDPRRDVSYPDADFYGGRIYAVYDRERCGAREILFASFSEQEIMDDQYEIKVSIISKP